MTKASRKRSQLATSARPSFIQPAPLSVCQPPVKETIGIAARIIHHIVFTDRREERTHHDI